MRAEVVVAKGKPLPPGNVQQIVMKMPLRPTEPTGAAAGGRVLTQPVLAANSLLVLPELLNPEDVQLVSVDVGQETVGLSERRALRCAPAVSHQINTIACTQDTHTRDRLLGTGPAWEVAVYFTLLEF